jgi:hypothetical protein
VGVVPAPNSCVGQVMRYLASLQHQLPSHTAEEVTC